MSDASELTQYWLTRLIFQRALAGVYLIAFLIAFNQARPLIGERGLLPAKLFLRDSNLKFWDAPSLFWFNSSDRALFLLALLGVGLSLFALSGWSEKLGLVVSMGTWLILWAVYLSFVNVGQTFWGFGWETLLLETGFLAIFFGSANVEPPVVVIWLLRWLLFRVMFGAGLIKMRGDPCWRDLTCMFYHYETQPLPNPLSWYFHQLPAWLHKAETAFTHFVELVIPFAYFAPVPFRWVAGIVTILFQATLILSGNLSWLNYITIVICIACFDDAFFAKFLPVASGRNLEHMPWYHYGVIGLLVLLIGWLSIKPARNLFARRQMMNASFDPLHLVNTYGAFGSITRTRYEVIIEGSNDKSPGATWLEYHFKGKPGDVTITPPIVSPYHYKLDWQMWFAAMSSYDHHPWILNLVAKLLQNDNAILGLMAANPFAQEPPKYIRAELYEYHFSENSGDGTWWKRQRVESYLPPLSLDDKAFRSLLLNQGWLNDAK